MKHLWHKFTQTFTPLQQLLWIGFAVRMVSVIFSKGFGWHDDHFLIIEPAQAWADDFNNNFWLPSASNPNGQPQGHSFFYVGIHFFIFKFFKWIGLADPQTKMLFVRLLHAFWSLLIIKYGYKIAEQYSTKKVAWYTGLFLALFWFMPFVSVRNLVEFVCVPPLLIAIYRLGLSPATWKNFLIAGLWLGIAFSIRFQSLFLTTGIGLALLIRRERFTNLLLLVFSFLAVVCCTQGLVDYMIWGRPFGEFMAYVQYNLDNASSYGTNNWHMYLDLILGLLIPPLSILLFAGYFYTWKKMPLVFWSVLIYLIFHTYFPNKQERFVMTVLPLIIVSGTVGMFDIYERRREKIRPKLFRFCKVFVIVINLILLPVLTTAYSKRHRVETMTYLYKKHDSKSFYVEDSNKQDNFLIPPLFYYGHWPSVDGITKKFTADSALKFYNRLSVNDRPTYIVFWQAENIDARVDTVRKRFPKLRYEATIEPGFIDKTLYFLNPVNDNHTAFIYRMD